MPPRFPLQRLLVARPAMRAAQPSLAARFEAMKIRSMATEPIRRPDDTGVPHVTEETAKINEIMGETKPEIEQGTPVQEIMERDKEFRDKAPEILKKEKSEPPKAEGTSQASAGEAAENVTFDNLLALGKLEHVSNGGHASEVTNPGYKFKLPDLPLPPGMNQKSRYDPIIEQVTKLLMKDGKLSKAQTDMGFILNYLRTAPAPTYNPSRPLLPDAPPASSLPLNPVAYLTLAIDSLAPLMKIRNMKGIAGGGAALPVPSALPMRQRRRQAFTWILDSVEKKQSKGSGKKMFAHRVAEEIVAVVEGKSSCWEKRHAAHKAATTSRANLSTVSKMRQKKGNMKGPYSN